jgi:hypothetical protein
MHTQTTAPPYDEAVPRKPMKNRLYRMWDVPYLAAQMQAEIDEAKVAEVIRAHLDQYGAEHLDAARAAWAQLEAEAPEGKDPTKEQVAAFVERYAREYRAGR